MYIYIYIYIYIELYVRVHPRLTRRSATPRVPHSHLCIHRTSHGRVALINPNISTFTPLYSHGVARSRRAD